MKCWWRYVRRKSRRDQRARASWMGKEGGVSEVAGEVEGRKMSESIVCMMSLMNGSIGGWLPLKEVVQVQATHTLERMESISWRHVAQNSGLKYNNRLYHESIQCEVLEQQYLYLVTYL